MLIPTPDGRQLQVHDTGEGDLVCLLHHGTPGGAVLHPRLAAAASACGLRVVLLARPGYGDSTALPGRSVADVVPDSVTVLDALGVGEFVTMGVSGGGPHALAVAAGLPGRCRAAAVVSGVGPDGVEDLDFLDGMGEDNLEEFGLARQGRAALLPYLEAQAEGMASVTAEQVLEGMASLLCEPDRLALTADVAEGLVLSMQEALRTGVEGWLEDDLAILGPWGVDLAGITVPVAVWTGGQDLMVPLAHGHWLTAQVPTAVAHEHPEHGHLSLLLSDAQAVLADLRALAATDPQPA